VSEIDTSDQRLSPEAPQRPLTWPPIVEQISALAPQPERLYLVGGVVRDALLGRSGHDLDLATPDDGLKVARHLANLLGGAYYPVDPIRQTGRIILPTPPTRLTIDVARFRRNEPQTSLAHGLFADLRSRDFTINAIAVRLDRSDEIIDPLGGQHDLLQHKLLRQCSPTSILDDPVRALRAVRLALAFGLHLPQPTRNAARAASKHLVNPDGTLRQPERARDELFKMLHGPRPAASFRLLHQLGLFAPIYPYQMPDSRRFDYQLAVTASLYRLLAVIGAQRDDNSAAQLTLGVAVMVLDRFRSALQEHLDQLVTDDRPLAALLLLGALSSGEANLPLWSDRLHLSNAEKRVLASLEASIHFKLASNPSIDKRWIHRYFRETGETGIDGVLLALAQYLADHPFQIDPETWGALLEDVAAPLLGAYFRSYNQVIAPPPLVDGNDLIEHLNLGPGPAIGLLLQTLLEEQAAGAITTKKQALRLAKRLAADRDQQAEKDA
jgi:tRNA nucleotidyltransferase/poly(A) polymerase